MNQSANQSSQQALNRNCHRFEQLYHGSEAKNSYCLGNNVAKEYMCPLVSQGKISDMPMNPWFSKQIPKDIACHLKQPLLGKYHLCPNQSNVSHYQEDPFQRGQFNPRGTTEQTGGYVVTANPQGLSSISVPRSDPYENYPAQEGYYVKRCIGDRNLYPDRREQSPIDNSKPPVPPLATKVTIDSNGRVPTFTSGTGVGITGFSKPMEYLEVETPNEITSEFIMNSNIVPSYYPDMVYDAIGKRPVYTARNLEYNIPETILVDRPNYVGHDAGCHQPHWSPNCI